MLKSTNILVFFSSFFISYSRLLFGKIKYIKLRRKVRRIKKYLKTRVRFVFIFIKRSESIKLTDFKVSSVM